MKKIIITIVLFLFVCLNLTSFKSVNATTNTNQLDLAKNSKSAILIEATTNKILYEKNSNEKLPPASMTKILTIKLIMDAISSGNINNEDLVITSKKASSIDGSRIFLSLDEQMKVSDLLKSVIIASANDAAISLAEYISGSEEGFVIKMNEEIARLGLKNTHFSNCTGLPIDNHYTTASDMAILATNLVNSHPEVLEISKIYDDYIRQNTKNPFWLVNTNKLVKFVEGVDGLKTGWTNEAGYCITTTMKKDDMRLISVVMGAQTSSNRSVDTMSLLNYGFSNYKYVNILKQGDVIHTYNDILMFPEKVELKCSKQIGLVLPKNGELGKVDKTFTIDKIAIKTKDYQNAGKVIINYDGKSYCEVDLYIENTYLKANYFKVLLNILNKIFS